jgi:superfamily II DNA or RNA helicase
MKTNIPFKNKSSPTNKGDPLDSIDKTLLNTYLGKQGYTIRKEQLTTKQIQKIKEELTIRPYTPGCPANIIETFMAYRESHSKLYVPRFYGEDKFGKIKNMEIEDGEICDLVFEGTLRDYQEKVVESYIKKVVRSPENNERNLNHGGGLIEIGCGKGKTVCALNIITRLKKKTLVIVHKEFLMNQWIERIQQYIPGAKVGKIQGETMDIEGKDIVLGMLQSLSMKEYPIEIFKSFGLTIIDEVHHISSKVFSSALFKIVTKYMLGLSATMNRRDGTTKVFKMFLGEVVFKDTTNAGHNVEVRAITYSSNNSEYNEVETDFRGNTALSKMISKICTYNRRSEFILQIIKDMLEENDKQQIMIIAQYKNILKYFYDAIQHQNFATVGYYVGGMKEQALKQSETKQIVLATYTMAAEGLDIKTLTTLAMVTPMTNIEQAVGRILRQQHDFPAIVLDIVDTHENFQKQWFKRRRFYKSKGYKIVQTNSNNYVKDWVHQKKVKDGKEGGDIKENGEEDEEDEEEEEEEEEEDEEFDFNESDDSKETRINKCEKKVKGVCLLKPKVSLV